MRVLSLVPISRDATRLSRYSFLDEELRALAAAGVDVFVFSAADRSHADDGHVHVREVPSDSLQWRARALQFVVRYRDRVPVKNFADPLQVYRGVRTERIGS